MKFKRLSILLTLMLAFSSFFTSFAFADENTEKPNLVALGDSITYGWNIDGTNATTPPSLKAFPYLILEPGFFNVTNISFGGWTSLNILTEVNDPANESVIQNADVFTLDIGNNDIMQAVGLSEIIKNGTPVDPTVLQPKAEAAAVQLGQNLQLIFAKVRSLNPDAPIILYNLYNPFGVSTDNQFMAFLHSIGEKIVTDVNTQVISPFAAVPGTFIADAKTEFDDNQSTYIIPGDIHPTEVGQAALAGLATEILISLMPEELVVELTAPTEETEGPVTITVNTNAEEVLSMRWLEGEKTVDDFYAEDGSELGNVLENTNTFEVTKNGTYTVYVLDGYGQEVVGTITIGNIKEDTTAPPVENPTPTPTPKPTTPATPSTGTGQPLPNTASPAYNFVGVGAVVLFAGFAAWKIQQRRRKEA